MPKVTVITRKAYGGAYDVMSSQARARRHQLRLADRRDRRHGTGRRGQHHLQRRDRPRPPIRWRAKAAFVAEYHEKFANPYVAAALGYVDEVIAPRDTREKVIAALDMLKNKRDTNPPKKHGNLPAISSNSRCRSRARVIFWSGQMKKLCWFVVGAVAVAGCAGKMPEPRTPTMVRSFRGTIVPGYYVSPVSYEHYIRAQLLSNDGRAEEASDELRQAIASDGASPYLRTRLAEELLTLGRVDEARDEIEAALHLDTQFAEAHVDLARVKLRLGDGAGAELSLSGPSTSTARAKTPTCCW